jgi:hypothetical protein
VYQFETNRSTSRMRCHRGGFGPRSSVRIPRDRRHHCVSSSGWPVVAYPTFCSAWEPSSREPPPNQVRSPWSPTALRPGAPSAPKLVARNRQVLTMTELNYHPSAASSSPIECSTIGFTTSACPASTASPLTSSVSWTSSGSESLGTHLEPLSIVHARGSARKSEELTGPPREGRVLTPAWRTASAKRQTRGR